MALLIARISGVNRTGSSWLLRKHHLPPYPILPAPVKHREIRTFTEHYVPGMEITVRHAQARSIAFNFISPVHTFLFDSTQVNLPHKMKIVRIAVHQSHDVFAMSRIPIFAKTISWSSCLFCMYSCNMVPKHVLLMSQFMSFPSFLFFQDQMKYSFPSIFSIKIKYSSALPDE